MPQVKAIKVIDRLPVAGQDSFKDQQQPSIQHRSFILGLMAVLIVLIVIINAIRTDASPLDGPIDIQPTSEITIRQLDGVLMAETVAGLAADWRAVQTNRILCSQSVFETANSAIINDNIVVLTEGDSGRRYCFEASVSTGAIMYQLSSAVADFEFIAIDTGQSLSIISIKIHDEVLLARTSRPAYWQAMPLTAAEECTTASFANIPAEGSRFSVITYILHEESENGRYCFQAYDHFERVFRVAPAD